MTIRTAVLVIAAGLGLVAAGSKPMAQGPQAPAAPQIAPTNDAPNPYTTIEGWAKMPAGREWGSTSAVDIARDGRSIWVAERCGKGQDGRALNRCLNRTTNEWSPLDPVLLFDTNGALVRSFGARMIIFPHGIHVDRDGNVWVTDGHDNFPAAPRGGGAAAATPTPTPAPPATPVGHQIFKFSPEGKLLMTLGKAGGNRPGQPADPGSFYQPNDVITNDRGEIFVVEGHGDNATIQRLSKFDRTGKFLKATGERGSAPGQFIQPHALAFDSKGRLFVADRSNNRIQIYDQDLNLLETGWEQYSRISGLFIDRNDMIYAADSESGSINPPRRAWTRGIRIGSVRDGAKGKVQFFIPDPQADLTSGTLAAEGVAVDAAGNIYGAEVGPAKLQKYVRKK